MIPALSLVSSLVGASPLLQTAPAAVQTAGQTLGAGFEQVFSEVGEMANNLKAGEAAAISGLRGEASVQHVVESIMTAERSLQTAIAIRDKLVSAYQSISQMPI